ncbi:hypothetical protein KHA80_05505 [Anaerobacillus sp. HL2]|nr:hypothetical protein KHA80_05505 [Anaerobacillus sp. HL2]
MDLLKVLLVCLKLNNFVKEFVQKVKLWCSKGEHQGGRAPFGYKYDKKRKEVYTNSKKSS